MIKEHYLLYLDILGFSEMAKSQERVLNLYQIIDKLNVHQHDAFKSILFSDTLLVYNLYEPQNAHDHHYNIMYLAEFAQDLLFRLIGRDYYFRAILTKGEFKHNKFDNIEAFFGKALIDSYRDEKNLIGCGLFIDSTLLKNNLIFSTHPHCNKYHYVFLTQCIDYVSKYGKDGYPFPGILLDNTDMTFHTYAQITFLKDLYKKSLTHTNPKVRSKFQATWYFYKIKYSSLCKKLEDTGFNFSEISDANWEEAQSFFEKELKSDYYKFDPNYCTDFVEKTLVEKPKLQPRKLTQ